MFHTLKSSLREMRELQKKNPQTPGLDLFLFLFAPPLGACTALVDVPSG
jgi:hypothetical protein